MISEIRFTFNGQSYFVKDWNLYIDNEALERISKINLGDNKGLYFIILDFFALETGKAILIEIKDFIQDQIPTLNGNLYKKKKITKQEKTLLRLRIKKAIGALGDISTVNICGMFWVDDYLDYGKMYQKFVTLYDMPYNFHIKLNNLELCGASPEILLKISDKECRIVPLSGSIPNYDDEQMNKAAIKDLLCNNKEINEHDEIIRETISSLKPICRDLSIHDQKKILKTTYSQHISSNIIGHIRAGVNLLDVLKIALPPIAISGVPQKAAINLIKELEGNTRGYYGGTVGFINKKEIDFAVIIRTFIKRNGRSLLQVGSKISIGSDIESEVNEILYKARKVMDILK
jgi:anthranilate synthase component I